MRKAKGKKHYLFGVSALNSDGDGSAKAVSDVRHGDSRMSGLKEVYEC